MKRFGVMLASLGLAACAGQPLVQAPLGADRDGHGCISPAGYTWSTARQACIRVWEEGIALSGVQDETEAYVVLSADGTQAEVFLPVKTSPLLLARSFTEDGPCWTQPGSPWRLLRLAQGWRLWKEGVLLYQASNPPAR